METASTDNDQMEIDYSVDDSTILQPNQAAQSTQKTSDSIISNDIKESVKLLAEPVLVDEIITLDSDDDEPIKKDNLQSETSATDRCLSKCLIYTRTSSSSAPLKQTFNRLKQPQKTIKCVNRKCPRDSSDFLECSYIIQELEALLNKKPLMSINIPKKPDLVEIIDSDEEDEPKGKRLKLLSNSEAELEGEQTLQEICEKVELPQQLRWERENIEQRMDKVDEDLKNLEEKSACMHCELRRPCVDIVHTIEAETSKTQLKTVVKPAAEVINPEPEVFETMLPIPVFGNSPISASPEHVAAQAEQILASQESDSVNRSVAQVSALTSQIHFAVQSPVETGKMQNWAPCKMLLMNTTSEGQKSYRVQFIYSLPNTIVTVCGKEFAFGAINHKLAIGSRVIAQFPRTHLKSGVSYIKFIPGVIGEKPSNYNNNRYLVFSDYGQIQYVTPENVREIAESSSNVWEDVHDNLKVFIQGYLQSQTQRQRALLNVRINQHVLTERNGTWRKPMVVEIDCSLVKMHFTDKNEFEWIYRGSTRLAPLYNQGLQGANITARRNDPNIIYITIDDDYEQQTGEQDKKTDGEKNTAGKSTAPAPEHSQQQAVQPVPPQSAGQQKLTILNDNINYLISPKKVVIHRNFKPRKEIYARTFVQHECTPLCLAKIPASLHKFSPLAKPLLSCWERQIVEKRCKRFVQYKAPCGRRLCTMFDIRKYLILTKCPLNFENFDFDPKMNVFMTYDVVDRASCPLYIEDMSKGMEGMKIPIINPFEEQAPPEFEYSNVRIPMKGVNINTDPEFMACCDCTDDCANKAKCACFQLTIQAYNYNAGTRIHDDKISYVWKRLLDVVPTGIYECHSGCNCSSRCSNKVVQQPIQIKMHLIRTEDRGWGLQCCHDIPIGTFICNYAGRIHRLEELNAMCKGLNHGDEYFADLDLIENATAAKQYESGVVYDDSDDEEGGDNSNRKDSIAPEGKISNETDSGSNIINMEPATANADGELPRTPVSLRKLFGKNEKVYVIDAKTCGNVGRYFNHSCDPNLFGQNVLVDTHDMRFPWIAFFASKAIKAGDELTWDYSYQVGSAPGKALYCKCGAKNCRGRIL